MKGAEGVHDGRAECRIGKGNVLQNKVSDFCVPSRDVTNQTLPSLE